MLFLLIFMIGSAGHSQTVPFSKPTLDFDSANTLAPKRKKLDVLQKAYKSPTCDKASTQSALLVIDMQDRFATRGHNDLKAENGRSSKAAMSEIFRSVELAKKAKIPVVLVQFVGFGEINDSLQEQASAYHNFRVLEKDKDNLFSSDNLYLKYVSEFLQTNKIGTLIVAGANGAACVRESIIGALRANCNVVAIDNAITDFNFEQYIWPNEFTEEAHQEFQDAERLCFNCSFREVSTANDAAPFMIDAARAKRDAESLPEGSAPNATRELGNGK